MKMDDYEWKSFIRLNTEIPVGDRDWRSLLDTLKREKRSVPKSVGKILSHRDAVSEMERLIVNDMKESTFARTAAFLSEIAPKPWIAGDSIMPGIDDTEVDRQWYSFDPASLKIRHLDETDWQSCIAAAEKMWWELGDEEPDIKMEVNG